MINNFIVYQGATYTRCSTVGVNTLRPRQNGRHIADDIFKFIFLNEYAWIPIKISLKFVPKGPINNIPVLVQIMDWRRPGDKPLSEPMKVSLATHICVTRPQWVNYQPCTYTCHGHQWKLRVVMMPTLLSLTTKLATWHLLVLSDAKFEIHIRHQFIHIALEVYIIISFNDPGFYLKNMWPWRIRYNKSYQHVICMVKAKQHTRVLTWINTSYW